MEGSLDGHGVVVDCRSSKGLNRGDSLPVASVDGMDQMNG